MGARSTGMGPACAGSGLPGRRSGAGCGGSAVGDVVRPSPAYPRFCFPSSNTWWGRWRGVVRHVFDGGKISKAPCGADERTLRRWGREFSRSLPQWAGSLESLVFKLSRRVPGLVRYAHPLKRLEEALSWLPPLPYRWTTMVKTLWWLLPSHPLCLPCPP